MKAKIFVAFTLVAIFSLQSIQAQEDQKKEDKPVRSPYETTVLIDYPTTKNVSQGAFELMVLHRFGKFGNGFSDLHGIYAPSNIRLALNYGVTKKLSIGIGTEKNNKMQDFQWKYNLLTQTRSGAIPVSVAYYGNVVLDARDESSFGENYTASNRLSYFNEIIISRKINDKITVQTGVSYGHFNAVDSFYKHDRIGWHLGGRYKIWNSNSFIFEYTMPFGLTWSEDLYEPKPGVGAGIEFGTSTHAFQVFVANYEHIIRQKNLGFNQNDFFKGDILLAFNITVRF